MRKGKKRIDPIKRAQIMLIACSSIVLALEVLLRAFPLFYAAFIMLFMVVPIVVIIRKTNADWGAMFGIGILIAIISIGLFFVILLLAKNNECLKTIILWPSKQ